jgi:hypothetical protein
MKRKYFDSITAVVRLCVGHGGLAVGGKFFLVRGYMQVLLFQRIKCAEQFLAARPSLAVPGNGYSTTKRGWRW